MNREQLVALRDSAPADPAARAAHFGPCGQLFGWVSDPDKAFLRGWLPEAARAYPVQPMRIVEVGTFAGSTARGLIALSGGGQITCIDNFVDVPPAARSGYPSGRAFWEATLGADKQPDLRAFASLVEADSREVAAVWREPIDLLLVDGDHRLAAALADIRLFGRWVVSGGFLLVDDYTLQPVMMATGAAVHSNEWETIRLPAPATQAKLAVFRRR